MGAEQLGERKAGSLGFQMPKCNVEGGDRLHGKTAPADGGAGPAELVPEVADIVGDGSLTGQRPQPARAFHGQ